MRSCFLALLLGVPLLYFTNQYPEWQNPNSASRLFLTLAIVDFGTLSIDPVLERAGIPPSELQDKATHAGQHYTDKPPMISLLLTPIAWLLRQVTDQLSDKAMFWWLRLLGLGLPTLVFWLAFRRHARELTESDDLADAITLAGALGTNFFIYSTQFFAHVPAGICLFASYGLVLAASSREPRAGPGCVGCAFGAGLLSAVAVTSDYIVAFAVVALAVGLVLAAPQRWRSAFGFALGASGPLVVWMMYNQQCFGSPLRTGFQAHADPVFGPAYRSGFLGLRPPDPTALAGLLILPQRGEFFLSPFLLLAGWGWYRMVDDPRRRAAGWLSLSAFLGVLAFALLTIQWRGGWSVGSRYLVPAVPMLLVGVAGCLSPGAETRSRFDLRIAKVMFAGGALVGLFWTAVAAASFPAFPDDFQNPLRHLALVLLADRRVNPSLTQGALGDVVSVALYGAWIAAAGLVLLTRVFAAGRERDWLGGAAAVGLAAGLVIVQASIPEPSHPAKGTIPASEDARRQMYMAVETILGYETPLSLRREALKQLEAGDIEGAIRLIERSLELDPHQADAHLELSVAHAKGGRRERALEHARLAAGRAESNWRAHFQVGLLAEELELYPEALKAYDQAQKLRPGDPQIARKVAECRARTP